MSIATAFKRLHYPVDVIAQCVRWYLAYSLGLRDLEEMMAERGIHVDHSTLHRWILRITPIFKLMKPISKSKDIGTTCTEPLISKAKQ